MNFFLVFLFSFLTLFGITSFFILEETQDSVINAGILEMGTVLKEKEIGIKNLNDRASEDLIFAMKNPKFVEYFELPETKAGNNYDENNILQYTPKQNEIKSELEQWIFNFQNKFQVDETCIIDATGQEHARLVLKNIAPVDDLSSEESSSPFFEPSFEKNLDEVHIQYPYVSPDTNRWVFAYTSPVVLGDGEKPAFYHFEMPITIFQNLLTPEIGRMYVVDSQGLVISDSGDYDDEHSEYILTTNNNSVSHETSHLENNDFSTIESISDSKELEMLLILWYYKNQELHHILLMEIHIIWYLHI